MYLDYYRLRSLPFRLSPDHRFYFDSEPHKDAAACLNDGLDQSRGFIVITGEIGAGKTTLVNRTLSGLQGSDLAVAKIVTPQLEGKELLRMVNAAFGLTPTDGNESEIIGQLESFLIDCHRVGRRALLFIDEAQSLPDTALAELPVLSDLRLDGEPLLQIYLVGQPEFREILSDKVCEKLRQRVVSAHHLRSLEAKETKDYVQHRLQQAGWQDDPHLTSEAFREIHQASDGIPRRINLLCDRLFLFAYLGELHAIDGDVVKEVVADLRNEGLVKGPIANGEQPDEGQSESTLSQLDAKGLAPGLQDPDFDREQRSFDTESPEEAVQGTIGNLGTDGQTAEVPAKSKSRLSDTEPTAETPGRLPELLLVDRVDDDSPPLRTWPRRLSAARSKALAPHIVAQRHNHGRMWRPRRVLAYGLALLVLAGATGAAWQIYSSGEIRFGTAELAVVWNDLLADKTSGVEGDNASKAGLFDSEAQTSNTVQGPIVEEERSLMKSTGFATEPDAREAGSASDADPKLPGTRAEAAPGKLASPVKNAASWLQPAAKRGVASAQRTLGLMYLGGSGGVSRDYAEALKWLRKAARQGEAWAQMGIGLMYENNKGVPRNYVEAHSWYDLAVAGMSPNDEMRTNAVEGLARVAARMTAVQVMEAERLTQERLP